jgi:uncharacterized protein YukE
MARTLTKGEIEVILKNAPAGVDQNRLLQKIKSRGYTLEGYDAPKAEPKKSVTGFLGNVVKSGAGLVGGLAKAVFNPIDTVKSLGNLGLGAAQLLVPGEQGKEQYARNVGQFYKERYGGASNIGNTLYKDPVGALADVSLLATGGGAALRGAGALSKAAGLTSAGTKLGQIGRAVDPLQRVVGGTAAALKGATKIAKTAAKGGTAVVSGTTIPAGERVFEAARAGGDRAATVTKAIRGGIDPADLPNLVESALDDVLVGKGLTAQARNQTLAGIKASADIKPIIAKFNEWGEKLGLTSKNGTWVAKIDSPIRSDVAAVEAFNTAFRELAKNMASKGGRTPAALHSYQSVVSRMWNGAGASKQALDEIKKTTQGIVQEYAKDYKGLNEIIRSYYTLQDEMRQGLSLGKGANPDTILRKLMSSFGKNSGFRREMLTKLDNLTDSNFEDMVAGLIYSEPVPTGLGRIALAGGAAGLGSMVVGGVASPMSLIALAASSPRIIGEVARALGMTAKQYDKFARAVMTVRALRAAKVVQPIGGQTARLLAGRVLPQSSPANGLSQ